MEKQARHRPRRNFEGVKKEIVACDLENCPHCGDVLKTRPTWHMRKTVQTMAGPIFVAGRTKECDNPECEKRGEHYYASRVLLISLPSSTYGLDVLAFIGWQHEKEHKQLVEIQRELNQRGIVVNERNVGKLYRQFLALLGAASEVSQKKLAETVEKHGGLIFGLDGLQPEGCGSLLYVLYEVLSGTVVGAIQMEKANADRLTQWMQAYQHYPVLATLSDGEDTLIAALKQVWPNAPHQRCQDHFLGNVAEGYDTQLRQAMRESLGGLPKAEESSPSITLSPKEAIFPPLTGQNEIPAPLF
jgi:hypothetical protein